MGERARKGEGQGGGGRLPRVFGQRSRIVPQANEIPLVSARDLTIPQRRRTTKKTTTMATVTTTARDFAREKLSRESLLAGLCASVDNGRCRFLTGSKSALRARGFSNTSRRRDFRPDGTPRPVLCFFLLFFLFFLHPRETDDRYFIECFNVKFSIARERGQL